MTSPTVVLVHRALADVDEWPVIATAHNPRKLYAPRSTAREASLRASMWAGAAVGVARIASPAARR
jgi:hypothetical protein